MVATAVATAIAGVETEQWVKRKSTQQSADTGKKQPKQGTGHLPESGQVHQVPLAVDHVLVDQLGHTLLLAVASNVHT